MLSQKVAPLLPAADEGVSCVQPLVSATRCKIKRAGRAIEREGSEIRLHARRVHIVVTLDVPCSLNADAFWCVTNFYHRIP